MKIDSIQSRIERPVGFLDVEDFADRAVAARDYTRRLSFGNVMKASYS